MDLTVKNTLVWCSISVNGMPASAAAEQKVCVPPGDVEVTATPLGGFKLGDWHHTSGDTGNGEPGMISGGASKAKVVVGASGACAWICCPFLNGSGCPTTDQCP